jgi:hypothetical protein
VQENLFVIRILLVAVSPPTGGSEIDFDISGLWCIIPELNDSSAEVRSRLLNPKDRMQNSQRFSVRRFQSIAQNALVEPNYLQQLLGRRGILVKR